MPLRFASALAVCLAAAPAAALPDWGKRTIQGEPEHASMKNVSMGSHGLCPVMRRATTAAVPVLDLPADTHPGTRKVMDARVAAQRKRLLLAHRAVLRIQEETDRIVGATNQCSHFWETFERFRDAAAAAAAVEAAASLDVRSSPGWSTRVEERDVKSLERDLAAVEPGQGRYPGLCVPPADDPEVFVPAAPPAELKAAAAEIEEVGRAVAAALAAQRAEFAALVGLLDGRGCRELTESFEALRRAERGLYFEYRRDALRDAAVKELVWRKVTSGR